MEDNKAVSCKAVLLGETGNETPNHRRRKNQHNPALHKQHILRRFNGHFWS
jgi:hypothetical protein